MSELEGINQQLEELRKRLLRIVLVIGIITAFILTFHAEPIQVGQITLYYPTPEPLNNIAAQITTHMKAALVPEDVQLIQTAPGQAFFAQIYIAALVGIVGAAVGTIAGSIFLIKINSLEAWLFKQFEFQVWDRSIYAIGDIPNKIEAELITVVIISAIVACLAGAILPTLKAARRNLIETLQVNEL